MFKNLSKQSDYDNRYQLLNGKVIQKTLTRHIFFNKFIEVKIIPEIIYCSVKFNESRAMIRNTFLSNQSYRIIYNNYYYCIRCIVVGV